MYLCDEGISVCIPAFNEEGNVGRAIAAGLEALPKIAPEFELVVVDDGSQDGTLAEARAVADGHPEVKVFSHPQRRGVGGALRTAYGNAGYPLIFFISADNQYEFSELYRLLPRMDEADLIVGYLPHRVDHPVRLLTSRAYHLIARLLFGVKLHNINCIKLFRREILDEMPLRSEGPFIDSELVVRACSRGWRVKEFPVTHLPRQAGKQNGASARAIFLTLQELVRLAPELWIERLHLREQVTRLARSEPK